MSENKYLTAQVTDISDSGEFTAYASVEVVDEDGDIVRIDGMDLSYQMPDKHISIYPEHIYDLASGFPAVLGRIETLEKTTHPELNVPALKFTGSWAKNNDGSTSEIVTAYKELYESKKYMTSFSVGVEKVEGTKIKTGVDWTKTKLLEVSCTQLPSNPYANIIKKTLNKYGVKLMNDPLKKDLTQTDPSGVQSPETGYGASFKKDLDEGMMGMQAHVTKCNKDMGDMMQAHISKCIDGMCKSLNERFDDLEGAFAVSEDGPIPTTKSKAIEKKQLEMQEEIEQRLTGLLSDLRKNLGN
jgi:hypothetical protein